MNKPIKVIYILGLGHSGSTLSDLILGSHSCVESGGEIDRFWDYISDSKPRLGEIERVCTCGLRVNECDYWNKVRGELKKLCGKTEVDPEPDDEKEFEENNYYLMKAILEASGKEVFCDSSKSYPRLKKLLASKLFDVQIVHLIRDGRAVAFSIKRKKERIGEKLINSYFKEIREWKQLNSRYFYQLKNLDNYCYIKYEDLVANSEESVSKILAKFNLKFEIEQIQFWQFSHHNIGGNRMRMSGEQGIRKDNKYIIGLSFQEWWLGNLYALSGLRLFGYSIWRNKAI
jgi:hypothetical protein